MYNSVNFYDTNNHITISTSFVFYAFPSDCYPLFLIIKDNQSVLPCLYKCASLNTIFWFYLILLKLYTMKCRIYSPLCLAFCSTLCKFYEILVHLILLLYVIQLGLCHNLFILLLMDVGLLVFPDSGYTCACISIVYICRNGISVS